MSKAKKFQPMLAERKAPDLSALAYPVYASPKLDGFRALIRNGKLLGRSLKPISNTFTTSRFSKPSLEGLDGELILGEPTHPDVFNLTSSALRRRDGDPDVKFYCFDRWDSKLPFKDRAFDLREMVQKWGLEHVELVPQMFIQSADELLEREKQFLELGYEGLMLRSPGGLYKFGRTTLKEATFLKLKRFEDAEAVCVGFYEEMHNENEAVRNALGRTERSTHAENMVPKGTLGGLVLRDDKNFPGVTFECGTGAPLTKLGRKELWDIRKELPGTVWTYKFQRAGSQERPRIPVLKGRREAWDL